MSSGGDPRGEWNALRLILAATDGSSHASEAVDFAIGLAADHGADVVFVHVVPAADLATVGLGEAGYVFKHEPTSEDRAMLTDAEARAAARGVQATTALLTGAAADGIVGHGRDLGVDLIVVGSCGRGAIANALLGSVSLSVLRKATRPVVIVKPTGAI